APYGLKKLRGRRIQPVDEFLFKFHDKKSLRLKRWIKDNGAGAPGRPPVLGAGCGQDSVIRPAYRLLDVRLPSRWPINTQASSPSPEKAAGSSNERLPSSRSASSYTLKNALSVLYTSATTESSAK